MTEDRITATAFAQRFRDAVDTSVSFASTMVPQRLPESRRFFLEPNASFDGHPLVDDQVLYPSDGLPIGQVLGPLSFEASLDWLWREGKVPEWVDVSVCDVDPEHTYLRLTCCGRFTALERRLYYGSTGLAPFGVKSPTFPAGWES